VTVLQIRQVVVIDLQREKIIMLRTIATKIFGSRNDRILRRLNKQVLKINKLEPEFEALSDEELKAKTAGLIFPSVEKVVDNDIGKLSGYGALLKKWSILIPQEAENYDHFVQQIHQSETINFRF